MGLERSEDKIPSIYQVAIYTAEEILRRIGNTSWNHKIMLMNDDFLESEKYNKILLERMDFFTPTEDISDTVENLKSVFLSDNNEEQDYDTELEIEILLCGGIEDGKPVKIFLEVQKAPYRIPFELNLIPYPNHDIFPQMKTGMSSFTGEFYSYYLFPPQDYLSIAFYEIIRDLELIRDMSWYEGVYDVISKEPVEGRKVWESLNYLIKEYPIPSFEKRMDTLKGYENYGYMKKRWKEFCKYRKGNYPGWGEVIVLLAAFLSPIFEDVMKDEVFFGDWMPELGRYLD